ncbi:pyridine nucleotide-disulfide oxidoreductase [Bacillus sp. P14.5]|uniref:pyridine nucleotide-disulfide oxidoreductase n=1 Tax=Bacillus sp. P14.5 TaxID=1983400 RepID=UPI0031F546A5
MASKKDRDTFEIFAIWEYDSLTIYKTIENKVKSDKEHVERVQNWYKRMGGRENLKKVFFSIDQDFMESTVLREKTILH